MNRNSFANRAENPPPEVPGTDLPDEERHTDPGPEDYDTFGYRDWNDAEDRYEMIAEAAYYKAEQRGFEVGNDELDWLEAEQELLEQMGSDPVV